jgi:trans-L-3-hydroxyproline dehydratase
MYGAFPGPPVDAESDISVLFIHNDGFSTMCGHGIIALTKVALDTGLISTDGPETTIGIDTPAGRIVATASMSHDAVSQVSFRNVPSFVVELDLTVEVPALGKVRYDLAFGGGFYAYVDAAELGVTLSPDNTTQIIEKGRAIKKVVMQTMPITHPVDPDLAFLYGVIFVGPPEDPTHHSRNVCVFADGEVDRSPTGTGVSGRLAIHHARGEVEVGEEIAVESILGSVFNGRVAETTAVGGVPAVIPEVTGTAHITGRSELWLDPQDPLGGGFFIR